MRARLGGNNPDPGCSGCSGNNAGTTGNNREQPGHSVHVPLSLECSSIDLSGRTVARRCACTCALVSGAVLGAQSGAPIQQQLGSFCSVHLVHLSLLIEGVGVHTNTKIVLRVQNHGSLGCTGAQVENLLQNPVFSSARVHPGRVHLSGARCAICTIAHLPLRSNVGILTAWTSDTSRSCIRARWRLGTMPLPAGTSQRGWSRSANNSQTRSSCRLSPCSGRSTRGTMECSRRHFAQRCELPCMPRLIATFLIDLTARSSPTP